MNRLRTMKHTGKTRPWAAEAGIQNVEWLALVALLCVTVAIAGSTIQVGGRTIGGRIVGQISCWVSGWDSSQACGPARQPAAGSQASVAPREPAAAAARSQQSPVTLGQSPVTLGSPFSVLISLGRAGLRSVGITVGDSSSYVDPDASSDLLAAYFNRYDNPLVQDAVQMLGWRYNVYSGDWEKTGPEPGDQHSVDPIEQMIRQAELCVLGLPTVKPAESRHFGDDCNYLYTGVFDPAFYVRGGPAMASRRSGITTNVLAILAVVFALLAIISSRRAAQEAPRPVDWQTLQPGRTTQTELEAMLGKATEVEARGDGLEWLRYPSGNVLLPNLFALQNRVLVMADIGLDRSGVTADELGRRYGAAEKITYSRFARGARAFIWAKHGVTLIADWDSGRPYRIRLYEPMLLDQFMRMWGTNLPDEDPYQK